MCFVFILVAFAQVDWHDFVLVETVDFPESDPGLLQCSVT